MVSILMNSFRWRWVRWSTRRRCWRAGSRPCTRTPPGTSTSPRTTSPRCTPRRLSSCTIVSILGQLTFQNPIDFLKRHQRIILLQVVHHERWHERGNWRRLQRGSWAWAYRLSNWRRYEGQPHTKQYLTKIYVNFLNSILSNIYTLDFNLKK